MVVAGRGKSNLVSVSQVHSSVPLECSVLRHDLYEGLKRRIVEAVVTGLMRMWDDNDVAWVVVLV